MDSNYLKKKKERRRKSVYQQDTLGSSSSSSGKSGKKKKKKKAWVGIYGIDTDDYLLPFVHQPAGQPTSHVLCFS